MKVYLIWLAAVSVITFFLYGFDKAQSKAKGWRVPEGILHILAISGGFVGGWLGMSVFHHKTKKTLFTLVLLVSTAIHATGLYCLFFR